MSTTAETASPKKELSYSDMFPNRFLSADHFKGRNVTLTIVDVYSDGFDKKKKRPNWIVKFKETPLEYCLNKTNGYCIKMMFTYDLNKWIGKRITFFPTKTQFGEATVDAIRVWGSPDIPADMVLSVPQGAVKAPLTMTMHKTAAKAAAPKQEPAVAPKREAIQQRIEETRQVIERGAQAPGNPFSLIDPALLVAWAALGWTVQKGEQDRAQYKGTDYAGHLSTLIDEMNAREGSAS
jgi:hypothetical protein